jgi:rhodanese-related sulfurtransferase
MRNSTLIIIAIAVIVLIITLIGLHRYANESPFKISSTVAKQLLAANKFNGVLDVRTAAEREVLGYLPNSFHVPASDLDVIIPQLFPDKNSNLLVYCNTGQRARRATEKLHALGYKNTVYIAGSYKELFFTR